MSLDMNTLLSLDITSETPTEVLDARLEAEWDIFRQQNADRVGRFPGEVLEQVRSQIPQHLPHVASQLNNIQVEGDARIIVTLKWPLHDPVSLLAAQRFAAISSTISIIKRSRERAAAADNHRMQSEHLELCQSEIYTEGTETPLRGTAQQRPRSRRTNRRLSTL